MASQVNLDEGPMAALTFVPTWLPWLRSCLLYCANIIKLNEALDKETHASDFEDDLSNDSVVGLSISELVRRYGNPFLADIGFDKSLGA
jgi:hypothetical protein